jgi:hypothetical protein
VARLHLLALRVHPGICSSQIHGFAVQYRRCVAERMPAQTVFGVAADPQATQSIEKTLETVVLTVPMSLLIQGCFQRPHSLSKNHFADHSSFSPGCHIKEGLFLKSKLPRAVVNLMKEKSKSRLDCGISGPPKKVSVAAVCAMAHELGNSWAEGILSRTRSYGLRASGVLSGPKEQLADTGADIGPEESEPKTPPEHAEGQTDRLAVGNEDAEDATGHPQDKSTD